MMMLFPSPRAYLRLEYPEATYLKQIDSMPFSFEVNALAKKITSEKIKSTTESYGIDIRIPVIKRNHLFDL